MSSKNIKDIVNKIRRLQQLRKSVIIFLGAGASQSAGIPTAKGIVEHIFGKESLSALVQNISSREYFDVMSSLDPGERYRVLKKFVEKARVNETHLITGLLVLMGYANCIVTTNFDPLIKRALTLLNLDSPIYDVPNNVSLSSIEISYPAVFHLHGSLENVWQFNTLEELNRKEEKIKSIIHRIAPGSAWIIVGYGGGNEPVFNELCTFEKFDEGLFWVGYRDQKPPKRIEEELLSDKTKNAHYISGYDSDNFFINLFNELFKDQRKEIVDLLENIEPTIQLGAKLKEAVLKKETKDPSINKGTVAPISERTSTIFKNAIQLTSSCRAWIEEEVNKAFVSVFQPEPLNLFEKLINFIAPSYFYQQKVVNKVIILFKEGEYVEATDFLSFEIEKDEENPFYHFYYGVVLGEKAQGIENPTQRKNIYQQMGKAFENAKKYFRGLDYTPTELENMKAVQQVLWSREHNRAIELATNDNLKKVTDQPIKKSIKHLENATTIMPDSVLSWDVLSEVYFMDKNVDEAIRAKKKVVEMKNPAMAEDYVRLADFYRINQNFERAIEVLKEAQTHYPDNISIIEKLADSYIGAGQYEQAISSVEDLIETDPENPQYHLALGTQYYQTALRLSDSLSKNYDKVFELQQKINNALGSSAQNLKKQVPELQQINQRLQKRIDKLTDNAIGELKTVLEYRPDDAAAYNTLGVIYQNKTSALFEERNQTTDNKKAAELDKKGKEQLRQAMKYYEKAAEIDPKNREYWKSLYKVYEALGMNNKVEEVKKKLDIN